MASPSFADILKRGPPQTGPSGGRNPGPGNRNLQGQDRSHEQNRTSFDPNKSKGRGRGRPPGHQGNQNWSKGGRGEHFKQEHHSERGNEESHGRSQTSHENYSNRKQGYGQSGSNFVYKEPGSSVDRRQESQSFHHQTFATNMAQRSRQNSESKDHSAWPTMESQSATMSHSPSHSSAKYPSSESPTKSHSLSGSEEMYTQGSRLTSESSDQVRKSEPATPMKSFSHSDTINQIQLDYETKEKTNIPKESEKSGLSDAKRNKRSGSRQNSESKDHSAWPKMESKSATMSHSPSDSSAKYPSSESPTKSHSLSGSEEMYTQGSRLTSESSDQVRKSEPATPMKSFSHSDTINQIQLDYETKEKTNIPKESEKSGLSDAKRNKRSGPKEHTGTYAGVKDTKKFESQKSETGTNVWKGVPISELRRAPECYRDSTSLQAAGNESGDYQSDRPENREPRGNKSAAVSSFVLLPHQNLSEFGRTWENIAWILRSEIQDYWRLEEAIKTIAVYNPIQSRSHGQYNPNEHVDCRTLQAYFKTLTNEQMNHFFRTTLPRMQELALRLPNLFKEGLPILKQRVSQEITLSQQQVACLLANAFFNTFPEQPRNYKTGKPQPLPDFNFINLYSQAKSERKIEKLKCIINYFGRVTQKLPGGYVTYRRVSSPPLSWQTMEKTLTKLHVSTEGTIEDERGFLQADFANKFVGGGVLNTGLVQEEIRFVLCPEMIVSRLITEMLTNEEVLVMIGCERFSAYSGYSDSFKFTGNYVDQTERDEKGRMYTEVVAMDASVFRDNFYEQFKMQHVKRELNKTLSG